MRRNFRARPADAIGALVQSGAAEEAALAARWLSTQRNDAGGFVSTQDTVVALRGLSQSAAALRSDVGGVPVHFSKTFGVSAVFVQSRVFVMQWQLY